MNNLRKVKAQMSSSSSSSSSSVGDGSKSRKRKRKCQEKTGPSIEGGLDGVQEGNLIHISDSFGFQYYFACISSQRPVVAFFMGSWSGPSKELDELVIELSDYYFTLIFLKIDLPLDNKQSELFKFVEGQKVRELPTFLFYYGGQQVFKLVGTFSDELVQLTHSLFERQHLLGLEESKECYRKMEH